MLNIVNTTPHPINFWKPGWREVITIQPCRETINARAVEEPAGTYQGAELVKTKFFASPEEEVKLEKLEKENPGAIIVGSIIAAQAFPGRVFALVPAPGYERVAPSEKRMLPDKFTTF